jgi:hypothetical protein
VKIFADDVDKRLWVWIKSRTVVAKLADSHTCFQDKALTTSDIR